MCDLGNLFSPLSVTYAGLGEFAVHHLQDPSVRAFVAEGFETSLLFLYNINLLESTKYSTPAPRDKPRLMKRI